MGLKIRPKVAKGFLIFLFVVVLLAGILLRANKPGLAYGHIGGQLGFLAVVALLVVQGLATYGDAFDPDINAWPKRWARNLGPFLLAIFLPLSILAAWYQTDWFVAHKDVHASSNPDDFIKEKSSIFGTDFAADLGGLRTYLKEDSAELDALKRRVDSMPKATGWVPELLVLNCGMSVACPCPGDYREVEYRVNWDLNAGAAGRRGAQDADRIRLCWRPATYDHCPEAVPAEANCAVSY